MTLPQQLLRLSYDTAKGRLDVASGLVRGPLLRAAAAAELTLGGRLHTAGGRVERTPGATGPDDPFLADVLAAVPPERPRNWFRVIDEGFERAEDAVLAPGGAVRTVRRRRWGVVPGRGIVADPAAVHTLRERVRDAVLGGHDPDRVPIADAVLALLAADGHVAVTFGVREQQRHRDAFRAVAGRVESRLPGFREGTLFAVAARRAAAAELRPRARRTSPLRDSSATTLRPQATRVEQYAPRFC
ncbi:GOLPH3/VPS74 family protein [Actinomycetospora flava]|uniref:GPP34 family phosphoprotein n=1 Tax=Actinomycetospora flava TaxID=3129232 RepID=A0ABU8MES8_9PSEU